MLRAWQSFPRYSSHASLSTVSSSFTVSKSLPYGLSRYTYALFVRHNVRTNSSIAVPIAEPAVLVSDISDAITKITLNRPKALNSINATLLNETVTALAAAHAKRKRIIILEGSGDRAFCAGADLKHGITPRRGSVEELRNAWHQLQDITRLTASSEAVVISAVQGYAVGGGAEIALAADFVLGGPRAMFKFPEVAIGYSATGGITLRLPHLVGLLKAKEILLRGQMINAKEAMELGVLTELVEDPKARAVELALELEQLPATSLVQSKVSLERALFPNMEASLAQEIVACSRCSEPRDRAIENFARRAERKKRGSNTPREDAQLRGHESPDIIVGPSPISFKFDGNSIKDINTAFASAVQSYPSRTFLRIAGVDCTYEEIDHLVARFAGGLRDLNIVRGDRVLVMMRNSVEMIVTWLATNRLGAVWVPINVELKSATLQHVVQEANAKVAILDEEFQTTFQSMQTQAPWVTVINGGEHKSQFLDLVNSGSVVSEAVTVKPSDTAAFLYTSGTTGKSKACIIPHEFFIHQGLMLVESFGLFQDDVLYCPFPLFHLDATALTTIPALLLGATAAISRRFSAGRFWDEIRESKATVYDFMGATLALTWKQEPSPRDRDHRVRLAWGVPIPEFAPEYERRFGHPLYTLYGSTEASTPIVQQGPRVNGSCGRLLPGFQLRIADENDEPLPPNTPGQMLLRSDKPNSFFKGYFNNHDATMQVFSNQWLHTGDLGKVDMQGNVYFVGRMKDIIRRKGENINAAEVEEEFLGHPDIIVAAAHGIPSQHGVGTEDDMKVSLVVRKGSKLEEEAIFEWAINNIARFQIPDVIEIVQELKQTPTGKVDKSGLVTEGGRRFDLRK